MPASAGVVGASRIANFNGGAFTATSLHHAAHIVAQGTATTPVAGTGNVTITDTQFPFPYDYCIRNGNQTISTFTASDWFTSTADRAAFIVVKGDLTFSSANITFTPSVRKLMVVLVVQGAITFNSTIMSMTARGGSHPSINMTGATGGFDVLDQIIPGYSYFERIGYAGGAGAVGRSSAGDTAGAPGGSGASTAVQSGGGGGGGMATATFGALSGTGAQGTAFGGGAGGGGRRYTANASSAINATANGGSGGNAIGDGPVAGGAGNPGGTGLNGGGTGSTGTGGTMVIFAHGGVSGSYQAVSRGSTGGTADTPGGGSGGGIFVLISKTSIGNPTNFDVSGSAGPSSWGGPLGGYGGDGWIRAVGWSVW